MDQEQQPEPTLLCSLCLQPIVDGDATVQADTWIAHAFHIYPARFQRRSTTK